MGTAWVHGGEFNRHKQLSRNFDDSCTAKSSAIRLILGSVVDQRQIVRVKILSVIRL